MQALALTLSYIGAPNQTYYNYFEVSEDLHDLVTDIELDLRKSGQLTDCHVLFHKIKEFDNDLLDDHILFHELGNSNITCFFVTDIIKCYYTLQVFQSCMWLHTNFQKSFTRLLIIKKIYTILPFVI